MTIMTATEYIYVIATASYTSLRAVEDCVVNRGDPEKFFANYLVFRQPLKKGDVYEVDWGIFKNIANQYKVESEDVANLK